MVAARMAKRVAASVRATSQEGSEWRPGACSGRRSARAGAGPRPGRRMALVVNAEQLAELPARDPRAAPRPGPLRPDVRRPLNA